MIIWGKVDLVEADNAKFFNISMSKVDLQQDKSIKITKKLAKEGKEAKEELLDLFSRQCQQ